jgi:hypothetical protein
MLATGILLQGCMPAFVDENNVYNKSAIARIPTFLNPQQD